MAFTYKTLGQADPAAATLTDVYTVPGATAAIVEGVTICNRSSVQVLVRLAVSVGGGAVATKDYVMFDAPVAANQTVIVNGVATMAATDKLRARSDLGSVSFNAFGVEIT